ncbi:MAG TPA: hypothetical protein VE198_18575 [Actinoallomurus sp.]|nr:hypothetical protein [Actinoallomurus sp.]
MTAVTTTLVRTGRYSVAPGPDSDICGHADEPGIYSHVWRDGLHVIWMISAGRNGLILASGRAWTRGRARVKASAAAHRPDAKGRAR